MLDPLLEELQAEIHQARQRTPRADYTPALQQKAMDWARARFREGWSHDRVASALGVASSTLSRWKTRTPTTPGKESSFRAVEVVTSEVEVVRAAPLDAPQATAPRLTLLSPAGYRVEGLDLDGLAVLLGRLG
jgi:hypothetical protein